VIRLTDAITSRIRSEAEDAYPNECCGFILGSIAKDDSREASKILPVTNARESEEQYHRFIIEPEDFMNAEMQARERKQDVIGIYHSHPDHPAVPSLYDREHALPFYSYVIVSVRKGASSDMTSWLLSFDRSQFNSENIGLLNV
jgi:proteasome lid subunit RPN8/RPN11